MGEKASFFVLRAKAVPEVLLRVVEAKRLLDSGKVLALTPHIVGVCAGSHRDGTDQQKLFLQI